MITYQKLQMIQVQNIGRLYMNGNSGYKYLFMFSILAKHHYTSIGIHINM